MVGSLSRNVLLVIFVFTVRSAFGQEPVEWNDSMVAVETRRVADSLLNGEWFIQATGFQKADSTKIDTVQILKKQKQIRVRADDRLAYAPVREPLLDSMERIVQAHLGDPYREYGVEVYSGRWNLRDLIPNYYRSGPRDIDKDRSPGKLKRKSPPLTRNLSREFMTESALFNINIALWHSHGWYYEPGLNRWEWQRARIFQTVEDLYTMSYTLPFLIPMLEQAGANVFVPRERDWQQQEVVVDNDGSTGTSVFLAAGAVSVSGDSTGFGLGEPPYREENPFRLGTYLEMESDRKGGGAVQYIPDIPEDGEYAVYISFNASPDNAEEVHYTVFHAGGATEFAVNQQMGGGTWVYLGKFRFNRGLHPDQGKVLVTNVYDSWRSRRITTDAVRFGGGMGNISRNGMTSNRPRYQEGARYYLQYAGFPDSLVWKLNAENDYNDDYQSRGEWVNYLMGAPRGPQADRNAEGLGIPVDLSLGFHTDAGITGSDTVVGTMGIYSTNRNRGVYPGGLSRMASRDLTDLVQSQIVEDLRTLYDPAWTRRDMWDKGYSEAYRPNTPAMLLELFSHQNFIDMRFGQEPMFRFAVSRAIYKGILKFLHALYGVPYVVQPLPVDHLVTGIAESGDIRISWSPVADPLEPTAEAASYRVYTRLNSGGFDNGTSVTDTVFVLEDPFPDSIYAFRVAAVNPGGESFPSEEVTACVAREAKGTVLIVNAFDRTGGQAWFDDNENSGFLDMVDQGVPYNVDLHTVGSQYDFRKDSPWLDDDSPGHGASYADLEPLVIPGNSFDFSRIHGSSIHGAGYSFVTVSDEAVLDTLVDLAIYPVVDYLAGEERTTMMPKNDSVSHYSVFPGQMLYLIQDYLQGGGGMLISGAHIATDVHMQGQDSTAAEVFGYTWRTSNASRTGSFYFMDPQFASTGERFSFNTGYDPMIYTVEGADALEPADTTAETLVRYSENNMSAGVARRGETRVVSLGFPFETINDEGARDRIMRSILMFITNPDKDE
ncbi:MAG: golvesin C-terminal-like domain-containing protein [Bacteroidales bacterium]